MPDNKQIIELTVIDKELIKAIAGINKGLKQTQNNADKSGTKLKKAGKKGEDGFKRVNKQVLKLGKSLRRVTSLAKSFGRSIGRAALAGGIGGFVAFAGLKSGIDDLQAGLENLTQINAATKSMGDYGQAIKKAGVGFVDLNNAFNIGAMAKSAGLTIRQTKALTKLGVHLGQVTFGIDEVNATQKIFKSVLKGTGETLTKISGGMKNYAQLIDDLRLSTTHAAKQTTLINHLMKESSSISSKSLIDTPMKKLLMTIRRVREELGGSFEIMKGMGKLTGALFAPLGAGVGGLLSGDIVGGLIGTLTGGLMTASITSAIIAGLRGTIGDKSGRGQGDGAERIGAIGQLGSQALAAGAGALIFGKSTIKISTALLKKAGVSIKDYKSFLADIVEIADVLREFSEGFTDQIKKRLPELKAAMKKLFLGADGKFDPNDFGAGVADVMADFSLALISSVPDIKAGLKDLAVFVKGLAAFLGGEETAARNASDQVLKDRIALSKKLREEFSGKPISQHNPLDLIKFAKIVLESGLGKSFDVFTSGTKTKSAKEELERRSKPGAESTEGIPSVKPFSFLEKFSPSVAIGDSKIQNFINTKPELRELIDKTDKQQVALDALVAEFKESNRLRISIGVQR